jgi:hypothetical protein
VSTHNCAVVQSDLFFTRLNGITLQTRDPVISAWYLSWNIRTHKHSSFYSIKLNNVIWLFFLFNFITVK